MCTKFYWEISWKLVTETPRKALKDDVRMNFRWIVWKWSGLNWRTIVSKDEREYYRYSNFEMFHQGASKLSFSSK
jgi:hypothetical protein